MVGKPFRPVQALAVDMFPHTELCELVVLLERIDSPIFKTPSFSQTVKPEEPPTAPASAQKPAASSSDVSTSSS